MSTFFFHPFARHFFPRVRSKLRRLFRVERNFFPRQNGFTTVRGGGVHRYIFNSSFWTRFRLSFAKFTFAPTNSSYLRNSLVLTNVPPHSCPPPPTNRTRWSSSALRARRRRRVRSLALNLITSPF